MEGPQKAVTAFLVSLVSLLTALNIPVPEWANETMFSYASALIATLLTTFGVWRIPNKKQ